MSELLWSDPRPGTLTGRVQSKRGVGIEFGVDVTTRFCEQNGLGTLFTNESESERESESESESESVCVGANALLLNRSGRARQVDHGLLGAELLRPGWQQGSHHSLRLEHEADLCDVRTRSAPERAADAVRQRLPIVGDVTAAPAMRHAAAHAPSRAQCRRRSLLSSARTTGQAGEP